MRERTKAMVSRGRRPSKGELANFLRQLSTMNHRSARPPQTTTALSNNNDEWFDPEESQSPIDLKTLEDLQTQSAAKDDQIARLTRAAESKTDATIYLDQRNKDLKESVRTALDPHSLYPGNTDVISIAKDTTRDIRRVSKKIDRQRKKLEEAIARQENRQLAQKDGQITRLSADNARLKTRIQRLKEGQQSCVKQIELMERKAEEKIKQCKERVVEAENHLTRAILPRTYQSLRDQFDIVLDRQRKKSKKAKTRQKSGQPAEEEEEGQFLRLSAEKARLNHRILSLEEGQRSCVLQVELIELIVCPKLKELNSNYCKTTRLPLKNHDKNIVKPYLLRPLHSRLLYYY